MTQRIELFLKMWLKELRFFFIMTQRIDFCRHESQNWTLFLRLTEFNLSLNMTHRIELSFQYDSQTWTFFFNMTHRLELFLFQYDSQNWTFSFSIWPTELMPHFEYEFNPFSMCLKEFNLFSWLKEFNLLFHMTQRIEPFFQKYDLQELNLLRNMTQRIGRFLVWLKELNFFFWIRLKKKITDFEPFFSTWLKELIHLVKYDRKNWTGFSKFDSKNWTFFEDYVTQRIKPFFDSRNWTFFFNLSQRIEPFFSFKNITQINDLLTMSHRIEPFFWTWPNLSFQHESQNLNPSFQHDSKKMSPFLVWLKEYFNFTKYMTQRIILFLQNMTQRIELVFFLDSKTWAFFQNFWRSRTKLFSV